MWDRYGYGDAPIRMTLDEAEEYAENLRLGSYDDWRLPTLEELASLLKVCSGNVLYLSDYTDETYKEKADLNTINGLYLSRIREKGFMRETYLTASLCEDSSKNKDGIFYSRNCYGINLRDCCVKQLLGFMEWNVRCVRDCK